MTIHNTHKQAQTIEEENLRPCSDQLSQMRILGRDPCSRGGVFRMSDVIVGGGGLLRLEQFKA